MPLTFEYFSDRNRCRRVEWAKRDGASAWTGADWSNEMGGECGEAQNFVKKLRRLETGYKGPSLTQEELLYRLGLEIADVFITADNLASYYGIIIPVAVRDKFNQTSIKQGLETRL